MAKVVMAAKVADKAGLAALEVDKADVVAKAEALADKAVRVVRADLVDPEALAEVKVAREDLVEA